MNNSWNKNSHRILQEATALKHYNRWIISLFKKYFGKNILEIGSGLGAVSRYLPQNISTLSDTQEEYLGYLKNHIWNNVIKLNIENPIPRKLSAAFDTVVSSNVFEHIKGDDKALENCFRLLKRGGKLLVFVPACPEIFGSLDISMGHFRRYTKEELIKKARNAGFKILEIKYVNFPGYFTWWLRGKMPKKSNSNSFMANVFDTLVVPLLNIEKFISIPFGQSLLLITEK